MTLALMSPLEMRSAIDSPHSRFNCINVILRRCLQSQYRDVNTQREIIWFLKVEGNRIQYLVLYSGVTLIRKGGGGVYPSASPTWSSDLPHGRPNP